MNNQNILKYYGSKLDLKVDTSELYDFILDNSGNVDIVIDYSELYDFELEKVRSFDNTSNIDITLDYSELYDFELCVDNDLGGLNEPLVYVTPIIDTEITYCNYTIGNQEEFSILTQNSECIQYQH